MRRVIAGIVTGVEDDVVARELAFRTQAPAEKPEQRIEPVCRSCQFGNDLYQPIQPLDVCQFVCDNDAQAVGGPGFDVLWK